MKSIRAHMAALGIPLPRPAAPVAQYAPFVRAGDLLFVSGQLPLVDGALTCRGQVGLDCSPEEAQAAPRSRIR